MMENSVKIFWATASERWNENVGEKGFMGLGEDAVLRFNLLVRNLRFRGDIVRRMRGMVLEHSEG